MAIDLSGVMPPIPTPLDASGAIDTGALAANLERWNQFDLAGFVVCGSNGEAAFLTPAERRQLWMAVRAAIPAKRLLIAGTGCESTAATIALSRQAEDQGADAVLVITPHYYGGQMTPSALQAHYTAVADALSIPVLLYTAPKFTHLDLEAETVAALAPHPNIAGIKDTSGNLSKLADIVRLTHGQSRFQVLAGSAGFFLPALEHGAAGGILALANVAPEACLAIQRHHAAGRSAVAKSLQERMLPVNAAVTVRFGIAGLKMALDLLGYAGGRVRSPLQELSPAVRAELREVLIAGGLLNAAQ